MERPVLKSPESILGGETANWIDYIAAQLGREPRGLQAVAAWTDSGLPAVIRVASVVSGKPFPTLFWLLDPTLCLRLDRLEASGTIGEFQAKVDLSQDLQREMATDHRRHKALRDRFLSSEERSYLETNGMISALSDRGIGGIAGDNRIRCLHTWYAAHLVQSNVIGRLIDARLADQPNA